MTAAENIRNCDSHHFKAVKTVDGEWTASCACGEAWQGDPRNNPRAEYRKCRLTFGVQPRTVFIIPVRDEILEGA